MNHIIIWLGTVNVQLNQLVCFYALCMIDGNLTTAITYLLDYIHGLVQKKT